MYFENNDGKIYYEDSGNSDASALIFIHGFPLDHSMWDSSVDFFKKKYRVITYDIRGLGKSTESGIPFTFEFLVDDLLSLMDFLEIREAVLVGLSMGGYIALRAMERESHRFKALVLCDTQAIGDYIASLLGRHHNILLLKEKGLDAFADKFIQNLLSPQTLQNKTGLVEKFRKIALGQTIHGLASSLVALAGRTNTEELLTKIDVPALLIVGEDDKVTPPDRMREMSMKIKGAEFFVFPGTGHVAPMEDPGQFQKILANFLEKNNVQ